MNIRFSQKLSDDLVARLQATLSKRGIVNIPQLAEEIRLRNEAENVALEDITACLLMKAKQFSAAMEFDTFDNFDSSAL